MLKICIFHIERMHDSEMAPFHPGNGGISPHKWRHLYPEMAAFHPGNGAISPHKWRHFYPQMAPFLTRATICNASCIGEERIMQRYGMNHATVWER